MLMVGKTIRALREAQGLSQAELAKRAELTSSFLSLVENDRRMPSLKVLSRISDALNVSADVIVWDAVKLPANLEKPDRQICEAAKVVVRRYLQYAKSFRSGDPDQPPRRGNVTRKSRSARKGRPEHA
jgi:transcriptional regulator with XRE-family HTH domain